MTLRLAAHVVIASGTSYKQYAPFRDPLKGASSPDTQKRNLAALFGLSVVMDDSVDRPLLKGPFFKDPKAAYFSRGFQTYGTAVYYHIHETA